MAHAIVEQQHRHGRLDQRRDDAEQDSEIVCPVNIRRFHQGIRHGLDCCFAYNRIIDAYRTGQDQRKKGIVQSEAAYIQIGRDHASRKKHGKQN